MRSYLDFEKPVAELEAKMEELRALESGDSAAAIGEEISRLEAKAAQALKDLYAELTPWQKTQVARHPERPHCLDYVGRLITDFVALSGDRKYGDDEAIVGGFGRFRGESICVIGHEKGSSTESRLKHNFGMARPEGYRKAERLMQMADRFAIPVLSLVDTAGAYPGIGAEERGQAEAIARSTDASLDLGVAERRSDHRRRRLGRRHRNRLRQPGADAGTRDLQRDLARGCRLDPVARHRQGAGGGGRDEDYRTGHDALRGHRPDRDRTPGGRPPRPRSHDRRHRRSRSPRPLRTSRGSTGRPCAGCAARSSSPWGGRWGDPGPSGGFPTPRPGKLLFPKRNLIFSDSCCLP